MVRHLRRRPAAARRRRGGRAVGSWLGLASEFPPRLPEQPIFYPVLNLEYAEQIARDWNTKREPFAGFVTRFEIDDAYMNQFPVQTVGSTIHQELWIPAEELEEFNRHIQGNIEIVRAFYGSEFRGAKDIPLQTS